MYTSQVSVIIIYIIQFAIFLYFTNDLSKVILYFYENIYHAQNQILSKNYKN